MRNIFLVMITSFKLLFTNKRNIITFFVFPVAAFIISMLIFGAAGSSITKVGILDNDASKISSDIITSIEEIQNTKVSLITLEQIDKMITSNEIDLCILIPEKFSEKLLQNKMPKISIITLKGKETTSWIENNLNLMLNNIILLKDIFQDDDVLFNRTYESLKNPEISIIDKTLEDEYLNKSINNLGFGIFIMLILIQAFITTRLILKDKQNKTYYRLKTVPLTETAYIMGNMLTSFLIIAMQIIFTLIFIKYVLNFRFYFSILELFIVLSAYGISVIALSLFITSISKSMQQLAILTTLIITPTCMLGGCLWPLNMMPDILRRIADFIPQKWAVEAIDKLQYGESFINILFNLAALIGFTILFFIIAVYVMKKNKSVESYI